MQKVLTFVFVLILAASVVGAQEKRVVTNLNDHGEGSLREALHKNGPAKVSFEVAGEIRLEKPLELIGDDIEVDGNVPQGIKLTGFSLVISGSRLLVSNLRIGGGGLNRDPKSSPDQDGILIKGTEKKPVKSVKILNCSVFGAVDEGIATDGPLEDIQIGRCMVVYGLSKSHHKDISEKTPHHSMAILINPGAKNVQLVQNLIALNRHRNPRVMPGATVGFVNNVVYGWGSGIDDALYFAKKKGVEAPLKIAFRGNFYKGMKDSYFGVASSEAGNLLRGFSGEKGNDFGSAFRTKNASNYSIWDEGNEVVDATGQARPFARNYEKFRTDGAAISKGKFSELLPKTILSAETAYKLVLENSGANPSARDDIEKLVVENVKNGTGNFIDSPNELKLDQTSK